MTPTHGEQWAAFYQMHRRALTAYAISLSGNEADAADLIQDVLLEMCKRSVPSSALPFVMRSLRNRAIDLYRRSRGAASFAASASLVDDACADLAERERAIRVREALSRLSGEQREVVVLKVYSGLTFREVAETMNCPIGTAASHYSRGMKRLSEMLMPVVMDMNAEVGRRTPVRSGMEDEDVVGS